MAHRETFTIDVTISRDDEHGTHQKTERVYARLREDVPVMVAVDYAEEKVLEANPGWFLERCEVV